MCFERTSKRKCHSCLQILNTPKMMKCYFYAIVIFMQYALSNKYYN